MENPYTFLQTHRVVEILDDKKAGIHAAIASSWDALTDLVKSGKYFALVSNDNRPGAMTCFTTLEFEKYKPGTERNKLFRWFWCLWDDVMFVVVLTPWAERRLVERHVRQSRMRVADGIPTIIGVRDGKSNVLYFPTGDDPHIFTLENQSGSPVYDMSPDAVRASIKEEAHQVIEYAKKRTHAGPK